MPSTENGSASVMNTTKIILEGVRKVDYRERIKAVREDRDLSQEEVGKLLHKSQQGYNHIEKGRAELTISDLVKLCRFYDLSADYLIGLTDTISPFPQRDEEEESS